MDALERSIDLGTRLSASGIVHLRLYDAHGTPQGAVAAGLPNRSAAIDDAVANIHDDIRSAGQPVVRSSLSDNEQFALPGLDAEWTAYAGCPLRLNAPDAPAVVGTLCRIETEPHGLDEAALDDLQALAALTASALSAHRSLWVHPARWQTPSSPRDDLPPPEDDKATEDVFDDTRSFFGDPEDDRRCLALTLDIARAGMFDYDPVHDRTHWDQRTQAIYGVDSSFGPHTLARLLHPDDRDTTNAIFNAALRGDCNRYSVHYRVIRPDGDVRYIHSGGFIERNADGQPVRVFGFNQDLTDHVERERQLASINRHISEGIYRSTPNDGLVYVNEAFAEMFGYASPEAMMTVDSADLYANPDDRARLEQIEREHGDLRDAEVLFKRSDGSTFWGLVSGTIVHDANGTPMYYDGAVLDITERKQQTEALQRNRDLLQQTQRIAGAWEYDVETEDISWSDAIYDVHGLPVGTPVDFETILLLYTPDSRSVLRDAVERAIKQHESYDLELQITTPTGTRRWVRAVGAPTVREGRVVKLSGALQDITERKEAETLLRLQSDTLERVARGRPLKDILCDLIEAIEDQHPGLRGSVLLYDPDHACIRHGAAPSLPDAYNDAIDKVPIGPYAGSCGTAMYYDKTIIVDDIETDPRWEDYRDTALAHGLRACRSPPSHDSAGAILGTFAMYYDTPKRPTERALDLIEPVQALAGIAIERHQAAQALRESEERYRTLVERSHDAIYIYQHGELVFVNERACTLTGYSRDALAALDPLDLIHPADRAAIRERARKRQMGTSVPNRFQTRLVRDDGTIRHVSFRVQTITFRDDIALMGSVRDVTDRQRAEQALRESKAALEEERDRLELALIGGELGMWDWDLTTDAVVYSERWASMLGYTLDDLDATTHTFQSLLHPDDQDRTARAIKRHLTDESSYFDIEIRMRAKDGSWRWILDRGKVLERAPDGTAQRMVGTHMDITERKEAEQALRRRERNIQALYSAVGTLTQSATRKDLAEQIAQLVTDTFGYATCVVRWVDEDVLRPVSAAYTENTVVGRPRPSYPIDGDSFAAEVLRTGETIHLPNMSSDAQDRVGAPGPLQSVAYVPVSPHGTITVCADQDGIRPFDLYLLDLLAHTATSVLDRIEREMALRTARDEAEEMNELKSAFLANMSHEVRTPLTSIIGFAEVLDDMNMGGDTERFVHLISRSANRLLGTLNSVLDLSQLEAGMMDLTLTSVDVVQHARDILESFTAQALRQQIDLHFDGPPHAYARADQAAVQRVMSNLLSNAVKFTEENGEVTVRVRTSGSVITIAVSDTGVGIDPEFMPHLFDAFRQESSGNARQFEGSGLGLAITRRLVRLMGGTISVESTKHEGTTVTVELPCA